MNLNVKSIVRMVKAYLPSMIEQHYGVIINMSSVASNLKGVPVRAVYTTTKAAVNGLTKSIAADYIHDGIRCNAICPATVQSPSLEERLHRGNNYDETKKIFLARQPMGRFGTPEEIGDLAVYLSSDSASFITGQEIRIDGGWSL